MKTTINTLHTVAIILSVLLLLVIAYGNRIENVKANQMWLNQVYTRAKSSKSGKLVDSGCTIEYIEFLDDIKISGFDCKY